MTYDGNYSEQQHGGSGSGSSSGGDGGEDDDNYCSIFYLLMMRTDTKILLFLIVQILDISKRHLFFSQILLQNMMQHNYFNIATIQIRLYARMYSLTGKAFMNSSFHMSNIKNNDRSLL